MTPFSPMGVTLALFVAGIAMGVAGACIWAWAVHTGQLRDLEKTKDQLFWADLAPDDAPGPDDARASRPVPGEGVAQGSPR